jgi:glycosyltransferase involved in cell wall biosynthesis
MQDLPCAAPHVSVVLPVYNGGTYLSQAIDSVLRQTYGDFELIAVDDGSTDGSADLIAGYAAQDPRVKFLRKPNSGISETLNLGLNAARGSWIARLDADDMMMPTRLERQLAFIHADPDVVATGSYYELMNAKGERCGVRQPLPRDHDELARYLKARALLTFTHPTMLYRRDLALSLGGYRKSFEPCEDTDLFARMLDTGGIILIQQEMLTLYRVHGGSISTRKATEMFHKVRFIFHNFYGKQEGRPPIDYDAFRLLQRRLPLADRLRLNRDFLSEQLYRAYTRALVDGRRLEATLCLGMTAALRPAKAIRRGFRTMPLRRLRLGA